MNWDSMSSDELQLVEEALSEAIIRNDRSTLPGDLKRNRDRLKLKSKIACIKWRKRRRESGLLSFNFAGFTP